MKVPFFIPWINDADKKSVLKAMGQRWLTNGPLLKKFEGNFQKYVGSNYSIGVSSATHALHMSVRSLNLGPGDEVILPTMTFVATLGAVTYCGAKPILADIDPESFNILPNDIRKKITKKTKAIIVVHYGGQSCDMDEILSLSKRHNLKIIEDCAHSLGSFYRKSKCGNIGNTGCFSFYPTKIITTGEGGMITTSDSKIFKKMKLLRTHNLSTSPNDREKNANWRYDVHEIGYNYRLDEIRSALGISQLKRIKKMIDFRIQIAKEYDKQLSKIKGLITPYKKSNRNHVYHLYTIKVENNYHMTRDELFQKLHDRGIGSSVQYYPLHLMSFIKNKYKKNQFPNANILKNQVLSLPIYPKMSKKEIEYVISVLK